jgi:hypothetical protein
MFKTFITNLLPDDHSLWKATEKFKRSTIAIPPIRKQDRSWTRTNKEKTNLFAEYLATVFTPNNKNNNNNEGDVETFLNASCQLSLLIRAFTPTEVRNIINLLNPHKAPGYDLITGALLKNFPRKAIVLLTTIYNSMLRLCYFPVQWKYAQIIMITKPRKPPTETNSYRPISLLYTPSKVLVFERLILKRLEETVPIIDVISMHQFRFRANHSTIEQCHRIVNKIKESMEGKKVCTSVFPDIQQAFDKVWHKGLLYKLKKNLSDQLYLIIKSYLSERCFSQNR